MYAYSLKKMYENDFFLTSGYKNASISDEIIAFT